METEQESEVIEIEEEKKTRRHFMKCHLCEKGFEYLWEFSRYGHNNPLKTQEAATQNGYCDECFAIKDAELDGNVVNKDKDVQESA